MSRLRSAFIASWCCVLNRVQPINVRVRCHATIVMDPRGGGQEIPRSHLVGFFGAENQRESHGTSSGSHEFSVTPSRLCDEVAQLTEMVRRKQEALTKFLKENEELKTSINDVKSEIKTLRKELAEKSDDNTSSSSGAAKRSCKLDTKLTVSSCVNCNTIVLPRFTIVYMTRSAKTRHNSAFFKFHFIKYL